MSPRFRLRTCTEARNDVWSDCPGWWWVDGQRVVRARPGCRCLSDGVFAALFADVCVDPRYQQRGIGTELVRSLCTRTMSRGPQGFAAFPDETNWVRGVSVFATRSAERRMGCACVEVSVALWISLEREIHRHDLRSMIESLENSLQTVCCNTHWPKWPLTINVTFSFSTCDEMPSVCVVSVTLDGTEQLPRECLHRKPLRTHVARDTDCLLSPVDAAQSPPQHAYRCGDVRVPAWPGCSGQNGAERRTRRADGPRDPSPLNSRRLSRDTSEEDHSRATDCFKYPATFVEICKTIVLSSPKVDSGTSSLSCPSGLDDSHSSSPLQHAEGTEEAPSTQGTGTYLVKLFASLFSRASGGRNERPH